MLAADTTESCTEVQQFAFNNFGDQLGALYTPQLAAQLGTWAPVGGHDAQLNRFAALACQYLVEDYSEVGWLELASNLTDVAAADHEALFDAAMTHLCPGLGYTRQFEWDNYEPFSVPGDTGAPSTTMPGAGPTSTTAPAQPAAIATISVQGVPTSFDCTSIAYPAVYVDASATDEVTDLSACGAADEALFARIIAADPSAFDAFVYSPNIGVFTAAEYSVEATAWIGFTACALAPVGDAYITFDGAVRNIFAGAAVPQPTPADTQLSFDEALRVLCPFSAGS